MFKSFFMALIALFLCTTLGAQTSDPAPQPPADQPTWHRPIGCDTLLTAPVDSFLCTCNCVAFNSKWAVKEGSLNWENLIRAFDFQIPQGIGGAGRIIALDADGPLIMAMFSGNAANGDLVTTRYTWQYQCRSGAFFLVWQSQKRYPK